MKATLFPEGESAMPRTPSRAPNEAGASVRPGGAAGAAGAAAATRKSIAAAPSEKIRNMNTPNRLGPCPKQEGRMAVARHPRKLARAISCCHWSCGRGREEDDCASIPCRPGRRGAPARRLRHLPRAYGAKSRFGPGHLAGDADHRHADPLLRRL